MKKLFKRFLIIVCILVSGFGFASCKEPGPDQPEEFQEVDYVSELKLDMNSETLKQEVTVKSFIDGDTTHFYVPKSVRDTGILKARYLAINTPESTGKIEEWGKAASNFTKEKLSSAVSIIIESDNNQWNLDSTGDRHLVWVWYKTSESDDYRNLNLEILQTGLAIASNSSDNRYGTYCMKAISQAKKMKLYVYSGEKDPNYPYGEATAITLKELRRPRSRRRHGTDSKGGGRCPPGYCRATVPRKRRGCAPYALLAPCRSGRGNALSFIIL